MPDNALNYRQAGGIGLLSDYYTIDRDHGVMLPMLKENIVFSEHSLATDGGFHEFQVIACRKVLSSFNDWLRERVHTLFQESLSRFGLLGLGSDDLTSWRLDAQRYEAIGSGWYRKTAVCMEV
jgi:chemotaxis protein methyltransferase CheR